MNTRKIILAVASTMFISTIAFPAFAQGHVEANEALFAPRTIAQIEPAALPQTFIETKAKTLAEKAFDLTDRK